MTDVSGIPNLGFGGGGYFGGIPNQQPAMSADQINASMWGRYSPQQAQSTLNNIYGPQGFGGQTAAYAGLGAAYGRATGGFRPPQPGGQEDVQWVQGGSQGARPSSGLEFGGGEDQAWVRGGSQGTRPSQAEGMGGIGSDARYGGQDMGSYPSGDVTRGRRLDPADRGDPYFMDSDPAGFNPSRYGGIGSDMRFGGQADIDWMRGGSQGPRPSSVFDSGTSPVNSYGGGANPGGFSPSPNYPGRIAFGGAEDTQWMRGGSQGARPSSGLMFGGPEDTAWMLGGSRGDRPSIMAAGSGDQMGPSGTAGGQTATPYAQMFRMPDANPEYFNPGIYAGSQSNYGKPYNGRPLPGDIGFSRQPSYPNIGYNPGMANWFANPGMNPSPSPMGTGGIGSDAARTPMGALFEQGNLNWYGSPRSSS